jgi:DNA polymerase IV
MRSVLFIDPPAFCTTLEGMVAPALRSWPLAIAPPAADRATILALSAEARRAGLAPGMAVRKAQRLCPDLIILPPNPGLYARASRALHEILRVFAPTIEPKGYGHAFLDLTGTGRLFGPPQDVAARIRREARERLRLPVSVGIAANKLVSQAAIRAGRRTDGRADGRTGGRISRELPYVPAGDERGFLAPQLLEVLPDLDHTIRSRLEDYQLKLIGEVAVISESALCAVFGQRGRMLLARARGIDPSPVLSPEQQSEFRFVHTFASDTNDLAVLHPMLRLMSERLGRRLRQRELVAGRLRLDVMYADYTTTARAVSLRAAVLDGELWDATRRTLALANTKRLALRTVALTLDRLVEGESQLELWDGTAGNENEGDDTETSEASALQHAIDHIRARYGAGALQGGLLASRLSMSPHEDPTAPSLHGSGQAVPPFRRSARLHQTATTFPKVALPSRTRCASAS